MAGKMAVIVIDMLKDFVEGSLKCERAKRIIPNLKLLLEEARKKGVPVIYSNDFHRPGVDEEFSLWGPHAVMGTEGAEVIEELKPADTDFIVPKRRYSGFFATDLDILLRELKVDTVAITGLHSNICVKHTSADAFFRGYRVVVPEDGVESFTEEDHRWGLEYIKKNYGGRIVTVSDLIKEFGG